MFSSQQGCHDILTAKDHTSLTVTDDDRAPAQTEGIRFTSKNASQRRPASANRQLCLFSRLPIQQKNLDPGEYVPDHWPVASRWCTKEQGKGGT